MGLTVLVCGGRDYSDETEVFRVLDEMHRLRGIAMLIHGDAHGADRLGDRWAAEHGIDRKAYPAQWKLHGKRAGRIRNAQMLEAKPDWVVAFPGGRGTKHMVDLARERMVPVYEMTIQEPA